MVSPGIFGDYILDSFHEHIFTNHEISYSKAQNTTIWFLLLYVFEVDELIEINNLFMGRINYP
jgi:hypothetical protein